MAVSSTLVISQELLGWTVRLNPLRIRSAIGEGCGKRLASGPCPVGKESTSEPASNPDYRVVGPSDRVGGPRTY